MYILFKRLHIYSENTTLTRHFKRYTLFLNLRDNWNEISQYQSLSEDFIRDFKDRVHWGYILECQTLSEDFLEEFKAHLYYLVFTNTPFFAAPPPTFQDFLEELQINEKEFVEAFLENINI